jgi:molybdopterin synthase sulfur carrier subunit
MPTIRIPAPLRKLTDGKDEVRVAGATVRAALDDGERQHPGLKARIFDDAGQVKKFIKVYANDEDIAGLSSLDTPVKDTDEISIVPAIAGG